MLIDPHNDLHQGTFSCSITANQCQNLAFVQIHANSFQNGIHTKRLIYVFDT